MTISDALRVDGGLAPRWMPQLRSDLLVGVNYWCRSGGPFMWRAYDDALVRDELSQLLELGITHTRSFLFWPDFHPAADHIDPAFVERYVQFLDTSLELGIPTIPTFLVGHMSGEDWDVAWRGGRDLYTDPFMLDRQAFFIRSIVERIGTHPAVFAWLVSNEFSNYAGGSDPDSVRGWAQVCVDAIRAGGGEQPVSLGDGAWTAELSGHDHNGFRIRRQLDIVDFIGPHSYPMDTDLTRVHFAAAWVTEMSHYGLPVVLEEFGVPDALTSREHGAQLYRQALSLSLLAGAAGWVAWNNTDFALTSQPPYSHHPFELGFGIVDAQGVPKPAAHEVSRFAAAMRTIEVTRCRRPASATSIVVPSYLDEHPRVPAPERRAVADITRHAYIAAKRAGLAPAMLREGRDAPQGTLILVPSNKLLMAPTFDDLEAAAQAGATVFIGWFSGNSGSHRGSWWPDVSGFAGLPHTLRYGMREEIDDIVEWTFEQPLGHLRAGDCLRFPVAGSIEARSMLPLDDTGREAVVVARDGQGRPALVRRRHGAGSVLLSTYSVEYFAAMRAHAHDSDDVRILYEALAAEAGCPPPPVTAAGAVVAESLVRDDGARILVAVNVTGNPITAVVDRSATDAIDIESGQPWGTELQLGPFDYRIAMARSEQP